MGVPEWTGYASATLSNPSSAVENFTLLIDLSDLPVNWWAHADSEDGTRGRAFKSTGEELPCDWIDFDLTARTGTLAVKWVGTMAASGTQTIHVYPPSKTNAARGKRHDYGQYNAYDSLTCWFSYNGKSDQTRNASPDLSENGSIVVGEFAGAIGNATEFDGTDDFLDSGTLRLIHEFDVTLSAYFYPNSIGASSNDTILSINNGSTDNYLWLTSDNSEIQAVTKYSGGTIYTATSGTTSATTWQHAASVLDSTNITAYFNGSAGTPVVHSGSFPSGLVNIDVGNFSNISHLFEGGLQAVKVSTTARSTAWLAQEAALRDQSTFWGTWAWNAHSDPSFPSGDYVSATASNPDTGLEDFTLLLDAADFGADWFTDGDSSQGPRGRVYKELASGDTDFAVSPIPPPDADLTDFSLLIDLSKMPGRWWDLVTSSDGTKGRAYKDDAAATELATDWIDFDSTNKTGLLRVLWSGTLSADGGQAVRIYPPLTGNSPYAASAPYGSDNAYASHWQGYWPLSSDGNDRTSNGNDLTAQGGPTVGDTFGKFGKATSFNGSQAFEITSAVVSAEPITMLCWTNSTQQNDVAMSINNATTTDDGWTLGSALSGSAVATCFASDDDGNGVSGVNGPTLPSSYYLLGARFTSDTARDCSVNGVWSTEDTTTITPNPAVDATTAIGWNALNNGSGWIAPIHDAQIHSVALSDDWVNYEASQGDQETHWNWRVPMTAVELPADWIDYTDSGTSGSGLVRCKWDHVLGAEGTQKVRVYAPKTTRRPRFKTDGFGGHGAYDADWEMYVPNGADANRVRCEAPWTTGITPGDSSGQIGSATDFAATAGQRAEFGNNSPFNGGDKTVLLWTNPDTVGSFDGLFGIRSGANYTVEFSTDVSGTKMSVLASSGRVSASTFGFTASSWGHYGFTVDGTGDITFVKNATFETSGSSATFTDSGTNGNRVGIGVGDYGTPTHEWDGKINEFQIHDVVRAQDWIEHEYEQSNDNSTFWGTWTWSGGGADALTAQDIVSGTPTVDSATLAQVHVLTAQSIASGAPAIDQPTLTENADVLTAQDIVAGTPAVDSATLGQIHALTSQEIATGSPVIDEATLSEATHALTAQDITSGTPAVDNATLGQAHALTSQEVASGTPAVDTATLGQVHVLTAQEIASGTPEIDQASLTGEIALTAQEIASGTPAIDEATLGQVHALTATDIAAGTPAIDNATLGQIHHITAQEIASGAPVVESATLSSIGAVAGAGVFLAKSAFIPGLEAKAGFIPGFEAKQGG